jgi:DNA-binding transcriptional ArsR family regulator
VPQPLATALFGSARAAVLAALLLRPDERFHVREIARLTGASPGSLHRELRSLTELGLLTRQEEGRHVYYADDVGSPVYMELSGLLRKTAGLAQALQAAFAPLGHQVKLAFIYGSMAAGTVNRYSDVDVMVVGDATFAHVVKALHQIEPPLGREVNPTVMSEREFRRDAAKAEGFVPTVVRGPKLWLIGGEDELGQLGEDRPAQAARGNGRRAAAAAPSRKAKPDRRTKSGKQR